MDQIAHIARDGAALSLVWSAYLLLLMRFSPRLFLRHFPKPIRDVLPPRSRRERGTAALLGLIIGVPSIAAFLWRTAILRNQGFWPIFNYAFGVLFMFNLVDLLIVDWLIVCRLKPSWTILPGTEHIPVERPYLHHFKGFLIGTGGLLLIGLAIAAVFTRRA